MPNNFPYVNKGQRFLPNIERENAVIRVLNQFDAPRKNIKSVLANVASSQRRARGSWDLWHGFNPASRIFSAVLYDSSKTGHEKYSEYPAGRMTVYGYGVDVYRTPRDFYQISQDVSGARVDSQINGNGTYYICANIPYLNAMKDTELFVFTTGQRNDWSSRENADKNSGMLHLELASFVVTYDSVGRFGSYVEIGDIPHLLGRNRHFDWGILNSSNGNKVFQIFGGIVFLGQEISFGGYTYSLQNVQGKDIYLVVEWVNDHYVVRTSIGKELDSDSKVQCHLYSVSSGYDVVKYSATDSGWNLNSTYYW